MTFQDQKNIGFKGTLVTKGNGIGIVIHTGMNTAIGEIASLMKETKHKITPLELKLMELGKLLIFVVFILTVLTVGIGVFHGLPLYDMVLAGVSLAVAVIPEGLQAIVTVALSLGVQRLIKRKAIVRKLAAVETLGCATIICTDKTGTITENKMTVEQIHIGKERVYLTNRNETNSSQFIHRNKEMKTENRIIKQLLMYSMLCNDASLYMKKGAYTVEGNPTDGALLIAGRHYGISEKQLNTYEVLQHVPFDSREKQMRVKVKQGQEQLEIIKGAPEIIIPSCKKMFHWDGRVVMMKESQMMSQVKSMSEQALRVIAICM